jgi:hypothetical protein
VCEVEAVHVESCSVAICDVSRQTSSLGNGMRYLDQPCSMVVGAYAMYGLHKYNPIK